MLEIIAAILSIAVLGWILQEKICRMNMPKGDVQLSVGSTGTDVATLQRKLNRYITSAPEPVMLMNGNVAVPINDLLPVDGLFTHAVENALMAVTGKNTIYVSQIDSL